MIHYSRRHSSDVDTWQCWQLAVAGYLNQIKESQKDSFQDARQVETIHLTIPNRQIEPESPWCRLVFGIEGGKLGRRIRDLGTLVYIGSQHRDVLTLDFGEASVEKTLRSSVQLYVTRNKALQFRSEWTTSIRNWSNLGNHGKNLTTSIDQHRPALNVAVQSFDRNWVSRPGISGIVGRIMMWKTSYCPYRATGLFPR